LELIASYALRVQDIKQKPGVPWLVNNTVLKQKMENIRETSLGHLTLDPGRHLASLDVTGLLSLDTTGINGNDTS